MVIGLPADGEKRQRKRSTLLASREAAWSPLSIIGVPLVCVTRSQPLARSCGRRRPRVCSSLTPWPGASSYRGRWSNTVAMLRCRCCNSKSSKVHSGRVVGPLWRFLALTNHRPWSRLAYVNVVARKNGSVLFFVLLARTLRPIRFSGDARDHSSARGEDSSLYPL